MQQRRLPSVLDDHFTPAEAAAYLGRTTRTLDRWRARGDGPPITLIGRRPLYRKTSLADWIARQEQRR